MAKRIFSGNDEFEQEIEGDAARTLIEEVYLRLRADIIEGRLAPGDKLRIAHLKTTYGVGAGTLREAITRLSTDALIVSKGQRGFWVSPISVDDLEDITKLRMHIEIEALRQSIRAAEPRWRERVRTAYLEMSAFEQPVRPEHRTQWETLNSRFHEALVSGCNSNWTLKVLRLLGRHSERYRHLAIHLPNSARDVHAEHTMIFGAAMDGSESRAALALEMHIRATPDLLLRAYRDGKLNASTLTQNSTTMMTELLCVK